MPDYLTPGDQKDFHPKKGMKRTTTKAARRKKGGMSRNPTKGRKKGR